MRSKTPRIQEPLLIPGALAVVIAVIASLLIVSGGRTGGALLPDVSSPTTLGELISFVEESRGRRFKEPVPVDVLPQERFTATLLEALEAEAPILQRSQVLYRALGLIGPQDELVEIERSLAASGVAGFYDPRTKKLAVLGSDLDAVAPVVVHELTHAFDDQHFDLGSRDTALFTDRDADLSYLAAVEGSAMIVMRRYYESMDAEDLERMRRDAAREATPPREPVPDALMEIMTFPYLMGSDYMSAISDDGADQRALDRALADPPISTQAVLERSDRAASEPPAISGPGAGGPVHSQGTMGALLLRTLMGEDALGHGPTEPAVAWAGDRYVTWLDEGGRSCARVRMVVGDPAGTSTLLRRWVAGGGVIEAVTGNEILFRRCA